MSDYNVLLGSFANTTSVDVVLFLDDLFVRPLWHLFGESLDHDFEDDPKENEEHYEYNVFVLKFLGPLVRFIYMLFTVILLLNLMIAVFNKSIERVSEKTNETWNRYRKAIILEYYSRSRIPIPFSIVTDLYFLTCVCFSKWCPTTLCDRYDQFLCKWKNKIFGVKMNIDTTSDKKMVHKWIKFVSKWEKSVKDRMTEEENAMKYQEE